MVIVLWAIYNTNVQYNFNFQSMEIILPQFVDVFLTTTITKKKHTNRLQS